MAKPHHHDTEIPIHAVLLGLKRQTQTDDEVESSMRELENLVKGLGVVIEDRIIQRKVIQRGHALIGEGRLAEIAEHLETLRPTRPEETMVLVVDTALTPGQLTALEKALEIDVLDRPGVILQVFEQRASTHMARIEVELAKNAYEVARLREDPSLVSREGGGGGRGERGNTSVELRRERLRELTALRTRELDSLRATQDRQRQARSEALQVALVGYTNAGKSSLMRALTGSDVLVEDKLFATLGTTVRAIAPPTQPRIFVSDTVGFIKNLPTELIASFRSTLAEARDADLLLIVLDASDAEWRVHLEVTTETLAAIGAGEVARQIVFNKIDRTDHDVRQALLEEMPDALLVSALDADLVAELRQKLIDRFDQDLAKDVFVVPYADGKRLSEIHANTRVVQTSHTDDGTVLHVLAPPAVLDRLRSATHSPG